MTTPDKSLRATLDRLGLRQSDLARMCGAFRRDSVHRWVSGKASAPHWLPSWLGMYEALTEEQRRAVFG